MTLNRRSILKMIGLAGLAGLFGHDLAIASHTFTPEPELPPELAELGYATKSISIGDGYVMVQICCTKKALDHYSKDFDKRMAAGESLFPDTWGDDDYWKRRPSGAGKSDWRKGEDEVAYLKRVIGDDWGE